MSLVTKQYALMSVTKLSTRFPNATPKIQDIINAFSCHMEIDLQQRGIEFTQLFNNFDNMRAALLGRLKLWENVFRIRYFTFNFLEPMPPMERDTFVNRPNAMESDANGEVLNGGPSLIGDDDLGLGVSIIGSGSTPAPPGGGGSNVLLDILDLGNDSAPVNNTMPISSIPNNPSKGQDSLLDLLGDLDMSSKPAMTATTAPTNLLDGLMTSNSTSPGNK